MSPPNIEMRPQIVQAIVEVPEHDSDEEETEPDISVLLSRLDRDEAQQVTQRLHAADLLYRPKVVPVHIDEAHFPVQLRGRIK